ncbi:hypothetical protein GOP47_0005887 [Adiantum capillus-veneris]|uniref:Uncharacterized protein n=1 Tax=Adiantum capillus-veneris TaxID=13818 RepID=A0A9D4V2I7_ADICA|nr:hypothetical protein GOP47_0005887 [Adiantum capillus-veneris]
MLLKKGATFQANILRKKNAQSSRKGCQKGATIESKAMLYSPWSTKVLKLHLCNYLILVFCMRVHTLGICFTQKKGKWCKFHLWASMNILCELFGVLQ